MAETEIGSSARTLHTRRELVRAGVSAIRFGPRGGIKGAYSILSGTSSNCAGARPRGGVALLRGDEDGLVWECDPRGRRAPVVTPPSGFSSTRRSASTLDGRGEQRGHPQPGAVPTGAALDEAVAARLWAASEEATGVRFALGATAR